ncbi:MAG: N-acetylmuramoyl-L-alanine amidase family protein [Chthoniobacterales bacterium]
MFRSFVMRGLALILPLFAGAPVARAVDEEMPNEPASNLSTLGRAPDWSELEKYQGTITHDEFVDLLEKVYCASGYNPELIKIEPGVARILTRTGTQNYFVLHFAKSASDRLPLMHWWKRPDSLKPATEGKPLAGAYIALDPGHLGGKWAKMEERRFKIGDAAPVQEGDMTLRVAQLLKPRLESLGAKVTLLREKAEPITPYRPSDFEETARTFLKRAGISDPRENFDGPADPEKEQTVAWQRELLFYRNSEIRRRADLVNYRLQPDLVLCLHFNAEPWGDPNQPTLVDDNHLHSLVNGAYLPNELELDDERFEMLQKLLSRAFPEELALAETIAGAMAKETGLPPYHYKTGNVTPVGASGYVYARNLMATRLYRCPTVYLEPYVMNSREVFARVTAGNYEGERQVAGKLRPSIYREYVDSVVDGLLVYFKKVRPAL